MKVTFTILGPAVGKERARRGKYGNWYSPRETVEYEEQVGILARQALGGKQLTPPLGIGIMVYEKRRKLDLDNIQKILLDSLAHPKWGIIKDDRAFIIVYVQAIQSDEEKVEITIWEERDDRGEVRVNPQNLGTEPHCGQKPI